MRPSLRRISARLFRQPLLAVFLVAVTMPASAVETMSLRAGGLAVEARFTDMLAESDEDFVPEVEVHAGNDVIYLARFPDEMGRPSIFITEMDPANTKPEVVVEFYSGGAHCCESIYVLEEVPGRPGEWQTVDLGQHDGGERPPQDLDGDGLSEIVTKDSSFLYAYGSYAESYAPPVIISVRKGHRVDLTRRPSMRPFLRKEEKRIRAIMRDPDFRNDRGYIPNGVLAGYVALKILLGEGPEGWRFMLKNRDPAAPPDEICPLDDENGECPVPMLKVDFPVSLAMHLRAMGYVGNVGEEGAD